MKHIHDDFSKYMRGGNIKGPFVMDVCKSAIFASHRLQWHSPAMGTESSTEPLCPRTAFSAINGLNFLFSEIWVCSVIISANCLPVVLFTEKNYQINYCVIFYIHATFGFLGSLT